MGWLFGKKKTTPKVPFPKGQIADDKALRFPSTSFPSEKVIEPNKVKQAVGFDNPMPPPTSADLEMELPPMPGTLKAPAPKAPQMPKMPTPNVTKSALDLSRPVDYDVEPLVAAYGGGEGPLYVKVDVYQRILGEIESLKDDLKDLHSITHDLESSEYNEENSFAKLKRNVKAVHDRLLMVDKTLFKSQGD